MLINYFILFVALILSLGGASTCCLSYGHGLGDIIYLFPLWLLTLIFFTMTIFFKKKIKNNYFIPIIFGVFFSFFIINIIFNKGPECSCNLF